MKTAPRASLTTTGATNDHAVPGISPPATTARHGTVSSAPVRPATTARHGTVSSAPVRPATTAPEEADGADRAVVILAVMLIGIVGCAALIGTAGKAITEGTTGASQSQQAEDDKIRLPSPRRNAMRIPMRSCAGSLGFSTVLILGSGGH